MDKKKVLWDNVIPDKVVLPARSQKKEEPAAVDLILERVPGVDYALYRVEYNRKRLFPEISNGSSGDETTGKV